MSTTATPSRDTDLSAPCPTCKRDAGWSCRTPRGLSTYPHAARLLRSRLTDLDRSALAAHAEMKRGAIMREVPGGSYADGGHEGAARYVRHTLDRLRERGLAKIVGDTYVAATPTA